MSRGAFSATLSRLVGPFAIALIDDGYQDVIFLARDRVHLALVYGKACEAGASEMSAIPRLVTEKFQLAGQAKEIGASLASATDVYFIGRGILYPIALAGALKLKELSYVHAEGYAADELNHGPIALIDRDVPVIVLGSSGELNETTMSNAEEVSARGARIVFVGSKAKCAGDLQLPEVPEAAWPFLQAVAMQMVSYFGALAKGTDVDQPKNLAKSVKDE